MSCMSRSLRAVDLVARCANSNSKRDLPPNAEACAVSSHIINQLLSVDSVLGVQNRTRFDALGWDGCLVPRYAPKRTCHARAIMWDCGCRKGRCTGPASSDRFLPSLRIRTSREFVLQITLSPLPRRQRKCVSGYSVADRRAFVLHRKILQDALRRPLAILGLRHKDVVTCARQKP